MTTANTKKKQDVAPTSDNTTIGRPKADLDLEILANLSQIGCTQEEIAGIMGTSVRTLIRHHAELIAMNKNKGKASLRKKLWDGALKGNPHLLVWLSKNELNMAEKVVTEDISNKPLPLIIDGENLTTVTEEE